MSSAADSELRYTEYWAGRTGLSIAVKRVLMSEQGEFQHVEVIESDIFGRMLLLDGVIMCSEQDEFVYHEMIAHPALVLQGDPRSVLIVGGGDGGTAREVLRHETVSSLDLVEIDPLVIKAAKRFLPAMGSVFEDRRLNVHVTDGAAYIKQVPDASLDAIIIDSSDPVGLAENLFSEDFFRHCRRVLNQRGVVAVQSESPFDPNFGEVPRRVRTLFRRLFPIAETYLAWIPTYAYGMWSFTIGSKLLHPLRDFPAEPAGVPLLDAGGGPRYYNAALHRAAFALPTFVERMLDG